MNKNVLKYMNLYQLGKCEASFLVLVCKEHDTPVTFYPNGDVEIPR